MIITLPYEDVKWWWVTGRYDIAWKGYAYHNGKLHSVVSEDLTDYDTMTNSCPCCSVDGNNWKDCHCKNYLNVVCCLTPLYFFDIIKVHIEKFCWYKFQRPYLFWKNRKRLN